MAIKTPVLLPDGVPAASQELPATYQAEYTTKVLRSLSQFVAVSDEWEALLEASGEANISLHHAWLLQWLQHFTPDELFIVLVRDEQGQLKGAAPFLITRCKTGMARRLLRQLQFVGTAPDLYDWMNVLIHPDDDVERILQRVSYEIISNRSQWDVLDLRFIESQEQLLLLERQLDFVIQHHEISQLTSISWIDLPEDFDDYPATLRKKKYRSDLNRIHNHLEKDFNHEPHQLVVHQPGLEAGPLLEVFMKVHQRYWQARGYQTEYGRDAKILDFYQAIHRAFSEGKEGWKPVFEFSILEIGGEPVSYHFDIQTRQGGSGCLSCYDPEVKKYRPGHLHIEAIIARTHQLGKRRFVFGRGEESYKNQWRIEKKPLWNLLAFRNSISHSCWRMDRHVKKLFHPVISEKQQKLSAD